MSEGTTESGERQLYEQRGYLTWVYLRLWEPNNLESATGKGPKKVNENVEKLQLLTRFLGLPPVRPRKSNVKC